jgi:hypothetical protein
MPPTAKYKEIRQAIAYSLVGINLRNKLITAAQFSSAFNTRVNLGGGIKLSEEILKKSFSARGEGDKYSIRCEDIGIGYEGDCVLCVLKSMQLARGAKRCTAFGIFDSLEDANSLASAEYVEDDNSVGRLQLTLTSTLKKDLIDCLMQYFPHESTTQQITNDTPPRVSIPKRRDVSLDEMEEESALSSNDETRDDSFGCVSFDADDFSYDYSPRDSEIVGRMLERECSTDPTENEVERHIRLMTRQEEIIAQLKSLQQEYQENRKMLGESGGGQSIHYIMDGLAGKVTMLDEHEMLSLDDFKLTLSLSLPLWTTIFWPRPERNETTRSLNMAHLRF